MARRIVPWHTLGLISWFLSTVSAQNYPLVADARCNCYQTNETTSHFFTHHKFFDFRELSQYATESPPPLITDPQASADAPSWNNSELMVGDSDVTGSDATVLMVNSANNVYIQRNEDARSSSSAATYLVMRTVRHESFQSAAEFESASKGYRFLSIRMYVRTRGPPGAVTAMFTYRTAPEIAQVQEADLEVRTGDPVHSIQYTNQPSWNETDDIPEATRNVSLPHRVDWSAWQRHRMDWNPGSSNWFVDGQLVSSIAFQAPRDASRVMFNAWSDGGSWSGNMSVNATAGMQIQWIDFVYNSTDPSPGSSGPFGAPGPAGSCRDVCSIDQTTKLGTPVLISQPQGGQTPGACAAAKWGQCAGRTWNGCTTCAAGTTCQYQNDYYSQCL
ncbi:carbohydrate-binding module family 1 protein [Xylariaceae sp. FL0662B]|nr:carbohydrate-binding module family 1 protein [Xylariaceae sp. FL0662B]